MASSDDRFNVSITFQYSITKLDADGKAQPFTSFGPADLNYRNMDYAQIVDVQEILAGLGQALVNKGKEAADKLKGK